MIESIIFIVGFIVGVLCYMVFKYLKTQYYTVRQKVWNLNNELRYLSERRNRLMNEIENIQEFMKWRNENVK